MMARIERGSLLSLEAYARERTAFRARVIEHKKVRTLALGDHITLIFEDELTVRYQVQEMMRVERMARESDIQHELETYNGILGGDGELGCTLMIEIDDEQVRAVKLRAWRGLWPAIVPCMPTGIGGIGLSSLTTSTWP